MRGYISLTNADNPKEIPVEDRVELYRIEDRNQRVFAEAKGNVVPLGVSDPTVSRKKDQPPVEIVPRDEFIEIRNNGNRNPVTVDDNATDGIDRAVEKGAVATLQRDATVKIGYQTILELVIERTRKKEVNVRGEKVIMGDEVDNSTTVRDSVINDSDIGDEGDSESTSAAGSATTVDDSVVNRSRVGTSGSAAQPNGSTGTDGKIGAETGGADRAGADQTDYASEDAEDESATQRFCEVHESTYTGNMCPECAEDDRTGRDYGTIHREDRVQSGAGGADAVDRSGGLETKYCIFCGEKVPAQVLHCPHCGEQLPE